MQMENNDREPESDMGDESPMSHNDDEMSEVDGAESPRDHDDTDDEVRNPALEQDVLTKLKMQVRDIKDEYEARQQQQHKFHIHHPANSLGALQDPGFPLPFSFTHPTAPFLPPLVPQQHHQQNAPHSSGSSHSSEGSGSSPHTSWSFEEQFKQVRQLYEISDDPKRKEFLDDLFSYMQKRGNPINRLPIMAKSVLDLYELYKLVVARGGLVDVINKKLWQEIIKGLHLPSSITSAAFTLRTQYMKYLYPYECEKEKLSTPEELQAAIDGNRREGRRSSYGNYDSVQRSPSTSHLNPLSIVTQQQQQIARIMNAGVSLPNGTPQSSHQHSPLMSSVNGSVLPGFPSTPEMEARMLEYLKAMTRSNDHMLRSQQTPSGSVTPPTTIPSLGAFAEFSRMNFWNLYSTNNNNHLHHPEPQKEALNLSEPATSHATNGKRPNEHPTPSPPPKRVPTSNGNQEEREPANGIGHRPAMTSIKIDSRGGSGGAGDDSLVVNMELNGVTYQGVLFAQSPASRGRTPHSQ